MHYQKQNLNDFFLFLIGYKTKSELQWSIHIRENEQFSEAKQLIECNYQPRIREVPVW